MKIELTLKSDYLPSWGPASGLRELLSNARDARAEFGATLDVRYRRDTSTLVIENEGCTLPHEALLFGHSTKTNRSDTIGKFGEGLKLGVLALVRAGFPVKIRSGDEVWVPKIERSDKFDAKVLVFYVNTGRERKNRVQVEIEGVAQETYEKLDEHFLFLARIKDGEQIKTRAGTLLLADRFRGKLFVKGTFVQQDDEYRFGYDLADAEIDRDRKMLARFDVRARTAEIWRHALATRPDLFKPFHAALHAHSADVAGVSEFNVEYLPSEVKAAVAAEFVQTHGADALPVSGLAESADIEHLGKRGIICPAPLRLVLEQTLGTIVENKAKLTTEVVKSYSWHELDASERLGLLNAIRLVSGIETVTLEQIDIVDFRDTNLRGMHKDGRELLAKKILSDSNLTLRVLVHEVAHRSGNDGEKAHVANIERIWSGIVAGLTEQR